jgi:phage terminase small subunit
MTKTEGELARSSMVDGVLDVEWTAPLAALDAESAQVYRALLAVCAPGHFAVRDLPLLAAYCRAVALEREAARTLRDDILNCPAALLRGHDQELRTLAMLAAKLGLCPEARQRPPAKRKPPRRQPRRG